MWGLTWSAFRKEERYYRESWEKRREFRNLLVKIMQMGSIIQKLADEIELHGSYEKYCAWRGAQESPFIIHEIESEPESEFVSNISVKSIRIADLVAKP